MEPSNTSESSLPFACTKLLQEKYRRKLTFAQIAAELGHDEVWTAAMFYGRATPTRKDIQLLADLLNLSAETLQDDFLSAGPPTREVKTPTAAGTIIYPFQEAISLYAPAIRSVITEKLGDGAIIGPSIKVRVERVAKPKNGGDGGEVRLVLDAKHMPYHSW